MTPELAAALTEMRLAQTDAVLGWLSENHPDSDQIARAAELIREAKDTVQNLRGDT